MGSNPIGALKTTLYMYVTGIFFFGSFIQYIFYLESFVNIN